MAIANRNPSPGLIHHSDRGSQYAGKHYCAAMHRADINRSMRRADNCYHNAFIESCFGDFKNELDVDEYQNMRTATKEISQFIDHCTPDRKQPSTGYLSPNHFEAKLLR
jgi:putative transposase